jgi:hypothetical protein
MAERGGRQQERSQDGGATSVPEPSRRDAETERGITHATRAMPIFKREQCRQVRLGWRHLGDSARDVMPRRL